MLSIFQLNPETQYPIQTTFDIGNIIMHRYSENVPLSQIYLDHGMVLLNNRVSIGDGELELELEDKKNVNIFEFVILLFGGVRIRSFPNSFIRIYVKIEQSISDKRTKIRCRIHEKNKINFDVAQYPQLSFHCILSSKIRHNRYYSFAYKLIDNNKNNHDHKNKNKNKHEDCNFSLLVLVGGYAYEHVFANEHNHTTNKIFYFKIDEKYKNLFEIDYSNFKQYIINNNDDSSTDDSSLSDSLDSNNSFEFYARHFDENSTADRLSRIKRIINADKEGVLYWKQLYCNRNVLQKYNDVCDYASSIITCNNNNNCQIYLLNDENVTICRQIKLDGNIDWKIERILWIGFHKNINKKCFISWLPKQILYHILHFLRSMYNEKIFNVNVEQKDACFQRLIDYCSTDGESSGYTSTASSPRLR